MTPPLHTGIHSETVVTEWSVRETRCRMVLTNPWALPRARRVLHEHLLSLDRSLALRRRHSLLSRIQRGGQHAPASALLADMLRDYEEGHRGSFPYGMTTTVTDCDPHRPQRESWELALETAALTDRTGLQLDPGTSARARAAQLCAERIAEATFCGVLIALGGDVATSGLAPLGGWRIALDDPAGAAFGKALVAIDGGAMSTVTTMRDEHDPGRVRLHRVVAPFTGHVVEPVWRSVTVAAANATVANAACVAAIVRGHAAPAWLDQVGLPARLVRADGAVVLAGGWPTD